MPRRAIKTNKETLGVSDCSDDDCSDGNNRNNKNDKKNNKNNDDDKDAMLQSFYNDESDEEDDIDKLLSQGPSLSQSNSSFSPPPQPKPISSSTAKQEASTKETKATRTALSNAAVEAAHKEARLFVQTVLRPEFLKCETKESDLVWYSGIKKNKYTVPCYKLPKHYVLHPEKLNNDDDGDGYSNKKVESKKKKTQVTYLKVIGSKHSKWYQIIPSGPTVIKPFNFQEGPSKTKGRNKRKTLASSTVVSPVAEKPNDEEDSHSATEWQSQETNLLEQSQASEQQQGQSEWSPTLIEKYKSTIKIHERMQEGRGLAYNLLMEELVLGYALEEVRGMDHQERTTQQTDQQQNQHQRRIKREKETVTNEDDDGGGMVDGLPASSSQSTSSLLSSRSPSPSPRSPESHNEKSLTQKRQQRQTIAAPSSSSVPKLDLTKRERLRAGDVVKYVLPTRMATKENMRVAAIVQVFPSKARRENGGHQLCLHLSDGSKLSEDCLVRIEYRLLKGSLKRHNDGRLRSVSDYSLDASFNDKVKDSASTTTSIAAKLHVMMTAARAEFENDIHQLLTQRQQPQQQHEEEPDACSENNNNSNVNEDTHDFDDIDANDDNDDDGTCITKEKSGAAAPKSAGASRRGKPTNAGKKNKNVTSRVGGQKRPAAVTSRTPDAGAAEMVPKNKCTTSRRSNRRKSSML